MDDKKDTPSENTDKTLIVTTPIIVNENRGFSITDIKNKIEKAEKNTWLNDGGPEHGNKGESSKKE